MEKESKGVYKIIGKSIKIILTIAMVTFIVALAFRMYQTSYKGLEETNISTAFKDAYNKSNSISTHAVNDNFSENGSVYAYSLVYIKESGYLQFTVRYNIRHIEEVILAYPEFKEENIRYELVDTNGKKYAPTILEEKERFNYHYFKLEFTNVDFGADEIMIKMILDGIDINVGDKSTLVVHRKTDTFIPYELSGEEKKQLS